MQESLMVVCTELMPTEEAEHSHLRTRGLMESASPRALSRNETWWKLGY